MVYDYTCRKCGQVVEVVKSVAQLDEAEECAKCGREMERIINFTGHVTLGTFKPGYYHAFGKNLGSKRELKEEMTQYEYKTGSRLEEVGNDNKFPKRESKFPEKEEMVKALNSELRKHG